MIRCAAAISAVVIAINVLSCGPGEPRPGTVKDEAMRAGIDVEQLVRPGPMPDYFSAMDYNVPQPTLTNRRMISMHPAGFTVIDVPAETNVADVTEPGESVDPLQRWVGWMILSCT